MLDQEAPSEGMLQVFFCQLEEKRNFKRAIVDNVPLVVSEEKNRLLVFVRAEACSQSLSRDKL